MNYWFGFRVVGFEGSNPGRKVLSGPYASYEEAKIAKQKNTASDMENTIIFKSNSQNEAEKVLETETFLKF